MIPVNRVLIDFGKLIISNYSATDHLNFIAKIPAFADLLRGLQ